MFCYGFIFPQHNWSHGILSKYSSNNKNANYEPNAAAHRINVLSCSASNRNTSRSCGN